MPRDTVHIVATAVEPEYVHMNPEGCGAFSLTIDLAHLEMTGAGTEQLRKCAGSIQVILMKSDSDNIRRALGGPLTCICGREIPEGDEATLESGGVIRRVSQTCMEQGKHD